MPILIDENIGVSPPKAPNIDNKIKKELDAANPLPTRNKLLSDNGFETIMSNNSFTVYSEDNAIQLKEVKIYSSKTLLEYDGFSISVFMCKNAASLAKIYMELKEPDHNELFVFIETNDAYNKLGSFLQVKVGSDIAAKKNLPFRDILNLAKTKKYEIDEKAVLNFLNLAIYKQEKKEIFIFHLLRTIFKAKGELEKIVFTEVGEFFGIELTGWMDELRIAESRWNPDHADYPRQAMLPSSKIDELTKGVSNSEQKQKKIRDYVFSQLDTNIEGILHKGDDILLAMSQNSIFGKSLFQKIHSQWKALGLSIANQKTKLDQKLNAFLSIIETLPDIVVAYVCGVINAVVDTISGFFELIGMICMARMYVNDAYANKEIYTSWIVETFENILEIYDKLEMDKFMDIFFEKKDQLFRQIILAAKKASLSKINRNHFIQAAYFCGYIVGFVVSFLLEEFLTGGTAAVKNAIAFLGKGASRVTRGIKDVGKQATKLFDNIHGLLTKAYREISTDAKKFFEKFKQWLDELIEAVKKKLGIAKAKLHKGGDYTKSFFENAGIAIKKVNVVGKVYGQTKDYTCVANSLKMALSDRNIMKTEEYLATALKTDKNGARILDIPEALHHSYIDDVVTQVEKGTPLEKLLSKMESGDKAIVSIYTKDAGYHAVLIDDVIDGRVIIRDPLPMSQGSSYSVTIEELEKLFKKNAVIIKK